MENDSIFPDSSWDEIETFFATPDSTAVDYNDDWLIELRAGWDTRLDGLYETDEQEQRTQLC